MDKTAQQILDEKGIKVIPAPKKPGDTCLSCHKNGKEEKGIMILLNGRRRKILANDLGIKKIPFAIQCSVCGDIWKIDGPLKVKK